MLFGCLIIRPHCDALLDVAALRNVLPGVDEVLGDADAGRRASDRDLAHGWAISSTGNFDVSSRDLANLIDLAALSSNYATNKLERERVETCKWHNSSCFHAFQELDFKTAFGSNCHSDSSTTGPGSLLQKQTTLPAVVITAENISMMHFTHITNTPHCHCKIIWTRAAQFIKF